MCSYLEMRRTYPIGGGKLIVVVQVSNYILKYKSDTVIMNDTPTSEYMVSTIRYVEEVVSYKDEDKDIHKLDSDIFAKA